MLFPGEIGSFSATWASLFCAVTPVRYEIVDPFQTDAERYSFSRGLCRLTRIFLALVARVGANSYLKRVYRFRLCVPKKQTMCRLQM